MSLFRLLILTPERAVFSGGVESLDVPASDGRTGILANHAAMISGLSRGEVRARMPGGWVRSWSISEGFLQVLENEVVVLTSGAASLQPSPRESSRPSRSP